nr:hypothetical protein [Tanacetum cinerariifolium]
MSDMIALLNDLSYIPPNNEQNEPTQGDIGEISNEPTQAKRNKFEELYASANEEMYLGCDYVTLLDFMAKFTYFKVKGKLTDSIFNEMLEFFQHVFPTMKGYKLPSSYYAIKNTFKTIGLGCESIHACVNDCFLFRGDNNKDVHLCPVCKTSRWKDSNTPRKKVTKKVLRYFSIIPRLQRLYNSSHTVKEMTWHATGKCTGPDKMQHLVYGLQHMVDDIDNIKSTSVVMYEREFFMLTLLIPGPKSPGKDIDVYLRPLIDDLKTINDFPAQSSLSEWSGQGYKACPTCNEDTPSVCKTRLEKVGHLKWLVQTKNKKCSKPQAAYSFAPENNTKFFQFIKRVKLPNGFGSNFKHKVTDNDTNIMGLKSHDCHIMMQRLLPYGLHQYFPNEVEKLIIKLCSFFKKICSATLMEDDMLKAQSKIRQRHIDNGVSTTSELFALACGPTPTLISVNSCVVNGVRFVVHCRDERRTTQNSNICSPGGKDGEMYYGEAFKDDQYILTTQVKQCFYLEDMARPQPHLKVVKDVNHKKFSNGGVIMVEEDPDVIHFDNSSYLLLSTSLNDLDNATLNIDASDDEDLVNVDDDDGVDMSADVAQGHAGDDGGDDRKGTRKPNLDGRKLGRLHTRQETQNLRLKKITYDKGPVPIRFKWDDKKTLMPLALYIYQCGHPAAPPKFVQYQQGFSQGSALGYKPQDQEVRRGEHQMESSPTREYPSLIHTFFVTHTVNEVLTRDEVRAIYEEMLRLQALGSNTPSGVPYTNKEINALARKGKKRGHLLGVGWMLNQYESTPEFGNARRSGGCEDDEMANDEDDGEDEEDDEDGDS